MIAVETFLAIHPQPPRKETMWDFMPAGLSLESQVDAIARAYGITHDEVRQAFDVIWFSARPLSPPRSP